MRAGFVRSPSAAFRLTERETDVLRLMAGGYSNREIGEALGVGEGTVKNHISSILSKMGVRDRARAVLKGLEPGLLQSLNGSPPVCNSPSSALRDS